MTCNPGQVEFVSEARIDEAASQLEAEDQYDRAVEALQADQPVVMGWMFSESFDLFTREEREYMLYLALILYRSIRSVREEVPRPTEEEISLAEESNWEKMGGNKSHAFHERLDVFFKDTPQEDLLAFAEDALSDYEDGLISKEGREALFIVLKTLVDIWTR